MANAHPSLFNTTALNTDFKLRDYQEEARDSVFSHMEKSSSYPLVVAPTGSGKSAIIAAIITKARMIDKNVKCLVLSHVSELITQNANAILAQCPECDLTFYSSKLGSKDLSGDVVLATIQSIYKKAYDFREAVDLILLDEAHLLSSSDDSMYRKFFEDIWVANNYVKIIGFTATPFRSDSGYINKGKDAIFGDICYEIKITDLINRGFLVPVITPSVSTKMDISGVKTRGGDYIQGQLEKAIDKDAITKSCVDEMMVHGEYRKKWIVFTAGIEHCEHVRNEIRSRGISCEMVHGNTPTPERARIIDQHRNGNLRCLVNVAVLTTGYDNPAIDLIALMRPTKSPVLYVQMVGRSMRISPGKENAICLDYGSVISTLGPIDQIKIPEKGEGSGEAPIKYCPGVMPNNSICNTTLPAAAMKCHVCGYEFPPHELNIDGTPSDAAVLSSQLKAKIVKVSRVAYYRHKKEGRPDSLRVDYLCGFETYREWVHLEHNGYAREKACQWWRGRSSTTPPNTVTESLERSAELRMPLYIHVKKIGKYHEVIGADFMEPEIVEEL